MTKNQSSGTAPASRLAWLDKETGQFITIEGGNTDEGNDHSRPDESTSVCNANGKRDAGEDGDMTEEYENMLRYAAKQAALPPVCTFDQIQVDEGMLQALAWTMRHSNQEIIARREAATRAIEMRGEQLWKSGAAEEWLEEADAEANNKYLGHPKLRIVVGPFQFASGLAYKC